MVCLWMSAEEICVCVYVYKQMFSIIYVFKMYNM